MKKLLVASVIISLILISLSVLLRPEETIKLEVIEPIYTSYIKW